MPAWNILKAGMHALAEGGGGSIVCAGAAVVHHGLKHHEAWAAAKVRSCCVCAACAVCCVCARTAPLLLFLCLRRRRGCTAHNAI